MDHLDSGYCLVLSGGGAKGVYHIGVWRALKELGIGVDAFIGASIGAIIAGLLSQGSDEALEEIGRTITIDSILALPPELTEDGELKLDRESIGAAKELFSSLVRNKGLDTSPLRELLGSKLDESAVRKSGKDLGIVTINLSDLEPREVFIDEMPEGSLADYLMASAAFPGFEQPVIGGKKYVDGGMHDNIPYAMARKRGYRRIIVSDISGAGRNRKPEIEGSMTVYIRNSIAMGGTLDFSRRFLDDFTTLGYLDTMRCFGRFSGYSYFVESPGGRGDRAERDFSGTELGRKRPLPTFPEEMRYDKRLLLRYLECAATVLEVERVKAYTYESLAAAVKARRDEEEARISSLLASGQSVITAMLREALDRKLLDGCPYLYARLVEECVPGAAGAIFRKFFLDFYPALPAGLAYLASPGH